MNMQEPMIQKSSWYNVTWTNFFKSNVLILPNNHHITLSKHVGITLSIHIGKMLTWRFDKSFVASRPDVMMSCICCNHIPRIFLHDEGTHWATKLHIAPSLKQFSCICRFNLDIGITSFAKPFLNFVANTFEALCHGFVHVE